VPAPVAHEIQRRGLSDPAAQAIASTDWLQVVNVPQVPQAIQAWDLGPGESAVLTWCSQRFGAEAIIDDLAGRRCAQALGIPVRGTLGLVLLGKKSGRIVAARPVVESLRCAGMYLSDAVMERALRMVGE
jgi:predicted nucleic acid-binding protein